MINIPKNGLEKNTGLRIGLVWFGSHLYPWQELTSEDLYNHFEKYGEVTDVYISNPWKHFAFVTFSEVRVAKSLIGKEHQIGVSSL